jgi:F420-dependent oxidoreductase-like protein
MRIGIFGGTTSRSIDEVVADAKGIEQAGYASFTLPQVFGYDAMGVLGIIGREVPRLRLMTGVVPTYGRHPLTMAQQALTVQAASDNRFALGIGLSHQFVIEQMFGLSFEKPVRHMREYLAALMPLLHDGKVSFHGETFNIEAGIDSPDRVAPPVYVAALGEQMLKLTGTVADGTMTWMTGPATLRDHTTPTITRAAENAGRPAPEIVAALPVCVTNDPDALRERTAQELQIYGVLPSYRAMLDREGAAGPADVGIFGDEAVVEKGVRALADAGVTEFVATMMGGQDDRTRTHGVLKSML